MLQRRYLYKAISSYLSTVVRSRGEPTRRHITSLVFRYFDTGHIALSSRAEPSLFLDPPPLADTFQHCLRRVDCWSDV